MQVCTLRQSTEYITKCTGTDIQDLYHRTAKLLDAWKTGRLNSDR